MVSPSVDVTERIFQALKNDPRTKNVLVDIVVTQGIATITGVVASEKTRNAVEEIARSQSGVMSVINEMSVR